MPDKDIYEYAVIRLVPKVEREEFLNVGIIVYAKWHKYLGIKYQLNVNRIGAFSADVDVDLIENYLIGWEKVCHGAKEGGAIGQLDIHLRFRWLTAARSTIIQSSKVHPGRSENPERKLQELFNKYVQD